MLLAEHNAELHRSSDRITALVVTMNGMSAELTKLTEDISAFASQQKVTSDQFEAKAGEQSASLARLTQQTEEALVKLEQALVGIDEKLVVEDYRTTTVGNIDVLRNQLYTFAVGAKAEISDIVGVINSGKGVDCKSGSFGKGFGGDGGKGTGSSIDRKEVAVWKLPEEVSKIKFRHWINAVDLQLEAFHGWRHADIIFNRIKRSEDPIDADILERCLVEAGEEMDKLEDDFLPVPVKGECPFSEKNKFLYTYLINRLNTDLHDRIFSIEGNNGFEVYRQVAQILVAVPENAPFIMNAELL